MEDQQICTACDVLMSDGSNCMCQLGVEVCPTGTLQELATFYKKNGQRARINKSDGGHMLERLKAAKSLLPSS